MIHPGHLFLPSFTHFRLVLSTERAPFSGAFRWRKMAAGQAAAGGASSFGKWLQVHRRNWALIWTTFDRQWEVRVELLVRFSSLITVITDDEVFKRLVSFHSFLDDVLREKKLIHSTILVWCSFTGFIPSLMPFPHPFDDPIKKTVAWFYRGPHRVLASFLFFYVPTESAR